MKKLIAIFLCLAVLMSLNACMSTLPETPVGTEGSGEAGGAAKIFTVTVVRKDGSTKDYTYETTEEFVGPVLVAEGLIEGNAGPYGLEITKVEGVQAIYNEDKAYWALFEGEEYALQGIDTTPVVDGGVYKLVYTLA